MGHVGAHIEKIWHSERLIYRGLRKEDQDFIFGNIDEDPVNMSLATPMLMSPQTRQTPDDWWAQFKGSANQLLSVVACLPAADSKKTDTSGEATEAAISTKPAEMIPIGFLNLEYGGYGNKPHNRSALLGITIARPYQNNGYGTEAVNWLLDWGFRHANLHSIHLGSVEYNKRAHRCYEKCGFTLDGRRRQCFWHDRKYWDLYFFSILEDEWEELQKKENESTTVLHLKS